MGKLVKNKQVIYVISLLLVAGFLMTSLASYFVSRASLRSEISSNQLPLTSDNIYSEIQRDLLKPIFISSLMATDTFLRDWVLQGENDEEQIRRYLNEIKEKYHAETSFFVSEKTRTYYHATGILKKILPDAERDRWYFRVREMQSDYEINVDPDLANRDSMTIFINHRVFDYNGTYIGATGVGLTVNAVKNLIENYQQRYARDIYFIDKEGNVQLHGSTFPEAVRNVAEMEGFAPHLEKILSGKNLYFQYRSGKKNIHVNTRYIPEFDWFLIVEQTEEKTIKNILDALLINLAVCAVITIVILFLTNLTINSYQNKIKMLRGIVPICSHCKQIRDDKGYWKQVEEYVSQHSEAEFSHGICPVCAKKYYPTIFGDDTET